MSDQVTTPADAPAAPAPQEGQDKQPAAPVEVQTSDKGDGQTPVTIKLPDGREVTPEQLAQWEKSHQSYEKLVPEFTRKSQELSKTKEALKRFVSDDEEDATKGAQDKAPDKVEEVAQKVDQLTARQDQEALEKTLSELRTKYPDYDETDALVTFLRHSAENAEYTLEEAAKASDQRIKDIKAQAIADYEAKLEEERQSQVESGGGNTAHVPAENKPTTLREATMRAAERIRAGNS